MNTAERNANLAKPVSIVFLNSMVERIDNIPGIGADVSSGYAISFLRFAAQNTRVKGMNSVIASYADEMNEIADMTHWPFPEYKVAFKKFLNSCYQYSRGAATAEDELILTHPHLALEKTATDSL